MAVDMSSSIYKRKGSPIRWQLWKYGRRL